MKKNSFIDMHRTKQRVKKIYIVGFSMICFGILCFLIPMLNRTASGKIEEQLIDDFFSDAQIFWKLGEDLKESHH